MKKKIIVTITILVFVLLTVQVIRDHTVGVQEERAWYVRELACKFSASIDTLSSSGNVKITNITGQLDYDKEQALNRKLKHNGMLDLFLYQHDGKLVLLLDSAWKYAKDDSINIDCAGNLITIYRDKKLLSKKPLLKSLRGRPF